MKRKFLIATTCLLLFSFITVKTSSAGEITLYWNSPINNEDGTPLTDLAGFKIYIKDSSGKVDIYDVGMGEDSVLCVNVPKCTYRKATIHGMKPGVYKVSSIAYDESGNESDLSNQLEVSVTDSK